MSKVKNKDAAIENNETLVELTKNMVVAAAAEKVFEEVTALENLHNLSENIATEFASDLLNESFMTEQLQLSDKQKDRMHSVCKTVVTKAKNNYLAKISTDERTQALYRIISIKCIEILEEMLSALAQEVNRGALINCTAVKADTSNDNYNKIELRASKRAGDITIPTRCLLVSTNCIDVIKHSITLDKEIIEDAENGEG